MLRTVSISVEIRTKSSERKLLVASQGQRLACELKSSTVRHLLGVFVCPFLKAYSVATFAGMGASAKYKLVSRCL